MAQNRILQAIASVEPEIIPFVCLARSASPARCSRDRSTKTATKAPKRASWPDGGCWEHCPGRSTSVSQFHITTQDDLPGPDGDEPYVLFVNQTEYGNARYRFAGLRLPAHQRPLGPARTQEVHGPALPARGQAPCRCCRSGSRTSHGYAVFAYFGLCQDVYARSLTNRVESGACWVDPKQHLAPIWRDDTAAALLHLLQ
jgi:hypothetical protein